MAYFRSYELDTRWRGAVRKSEPKRARMGSPQLLHMRKRDRARGFRCGVWEKAFKGSFEARLEIGLPTKCRGDGTTTPPRRRKPGSVGTFLLIFPISQLYQYLEEKASCSYPKSHIAFSGEARVAQPSGAHAQGSQGVLCMPRACQPGNIVPKPLRSNYPRLAKYPESPQWHPICTPLPRLFQAPQR